MAKPLVIVRGWLDAGSDPGIGAYVTIQLSDGRQCRWTRDGGVTDGPYLVVGNRSPDECDGRMSAQGLELAAEEFTRYVRSLSLAQLYETGLQGYAPVEPVKSRIADVEHVWTDQLVGRDRWDTVSLASSPFCQFRRRIGITPKAMDIDWVAVADLTRRSPDKSDVELFGADREQVIASFLRSDAWADFARLPRALPPSLMPVELFTIKPRRILRRKGR